MVKNCENCGAEFVDRSLAKHGRWCSARCSWQVYREANREALRERDRAYKAANRDAVLERKRQYHKANREAILARNRKYNEENREARNAKVREYGQTEGGRAAKRRHEDKRRALKINAFVEAVDRQAIFKRDGYTCQLCGKKVDMNKAGPDPMSPSIDHILPLSKGGTHEPRNVQLAHLGCNSRKNNTGVDQLRLLP